LDAGKKIEQRNCRKQKNNADYEQALEFFIPQLMLNKFYIH
jgi:hypothetical protein